MNVRRLIAWGAPLLIVSAAALVLTIRNGGEGAADTGLKISASLYDLIGSAAERIPRFVRDASSSEISIIVSSASPQSARSAAHSIGEALARSVRTRPEERRALDNSVLAFLRSNRGGLAAPETAKLLETASGRARVARRAMRRLYASPLPPVLGYGDDPFGLADGFVSTLLPKPSAKTSDGYPVLTTNGVTRVLIRHRLDEATARDLDRTIAEVERLGKLCDGVLEGRGDAQRPRDGRNSGKSVSQPVSVRYAGVPIHSAISANRCKREIGALTWFSVLTIAALAIFVFRSLRWLPLLASSLVVAAGAGALVLLAGCSEIHVMTLVMGTTVLGLVIDYSFHWLLSSSAAKPTVKKGLYISFLTTEISLLPLMFASIPVLRQSAVFLGVGLAAALAYVLTGYPTEGAGMPSPTVSQASPASGRGRSDPKLDLGRFDHGRLRLVAVGLLLAAAVGGMLRTSLKTEVAALYRPSTELIESERMCAAFGTFDLTAFPSLAERRKISSNVKLLYAEHGAALSEALGIARLEPQPEPTDLQLQPKALMDSILSGWTESALARLNVSIIVLLGVLFILCRRRALGILLPPVAAILAVAGALGWMGVAVNLFHLLAAFLLLGMGIDYAVFLGSGERSAIRPSLCSLLTSVAGFGALSFVSFPVVRSFGVVLGIGLPVAFLFAMPAGRGEDSKRTAASGERFASLPGMETLWLAYRVFGLRALHLLAAAVGAASWLSSPSVRRASPSLRKVVNFTRSLADKLVVMADGGRLPEVATDESPDACELLDQIRTGKGVFVLSSHVGTIEVLTALGDCNRTFHAWMDFDRTSVFNRFYLRHAGRRLVKIHPISDFGIQTVFEAGDWIDSGDCLVMAGDRGDGAFRFAAAFDHPVYFVACLAESGLRYRAFVRRLPKERLAMKKAYAEVIADLVAHYPDQHFVWA